MGKEKTGQRMVLEASLGLKYLDKARMKSKITKQKNKFLTSRKDKQALEETTESEGGGGVEAYLAWKKGGGTGGKGWEDSLFRPGLPLLPAGYQVS